MADTLFIDRQTPIPASWLNNVNDATYNLQIAGANTVERTAQDVHDEKVNTPSDYSSTFATALSTFNTNKTTGGVLRVPAGTHSLTTGAVFDGQRCNIVGDGRQVSIIDFRPASAGTALKYHNTSDGGMYQGKITGLGFTAGANAQNKTAIALINAANTEVSHIGIATDAWLGDSIGLYTEGRQSLYFHRSEIVCARPVVVGKNPITTTPVFATLNTDHYVLEHLELVGTSATRPIIEIEPDVMTTTMTLRNIAWVGGKNGLQWIESGSAGTSYMLTLDQGRFEQAIISAGIGYCVYLDGSGGSGLQSLAIRDTYFGTAPGFEREGMYLRKCQNVLLDNCWFVQGAGRIAIDMTFVAGSRLTLNNCFIDSAATLTLTNARCVSRTSSANRISGEWVYDEGTQTGFDNGERTSDVYNTGTSQTIANNTAITIAGQTYVGFVMISTDEDTGAIFFLNGATASAPKRVSDPDNFFTDTKDSANQYNVYWDAGSTSYVLQNKRTVGDHAVRVFRIGGVV